MNARFPHSSRLLDQSLPQLDTEGTNTLALRAKGGDKGAAEELIRRTVRMVWRPLVSLRHTFPEHFDDVFVECVGVGTMLALKYWEPERGAYGLLFMVTIHNLTTRALARARGQPVLKAWLPRREVSISTPVGEEEGRPAFLGDILPTEVAPVDERLAYRQAESRTRTLLLQLPERVREVVVAESCDTARLAQREGVTKQAINHRKLKAIAWMRSRLEGGNDMHPFVGSGGYWKRRKAAQ